MRKILDQSLNVKVWNEAAASDGYNLNIKALQASPFYANILEQNWFVRAVLFAAFDENKNNTGCCLVYHHLKGGNACRLYIPRLGFWGDNNTLTRLSSAVNMYCASKKIKYSVSPLISERQDPLWEKKYLVVKLGETETEIFTKLRKKTRYTIRRLEKTLNIVEGKEYVMPFHDIYKTRMSAKNLPAKPLQYFKTLISELDGARLFVALKGGRVIAGMIFCRLDNVAYYLYNSACSEGLKLSANHLLMWKSLCYFNTNGVECVDLGESIEGSGTYLFKKTHFNGVMRTQEYTDIIGHTHSNNQKLELNVRRSLQYRTAKIVPKAFAISLASYNQIL